ncbi:zinc finger protein Paris-like [Drosophila takahashii]|uniref:zinc finger protein Paris-like n=1 Tax=Drosophila takahashii TaxID=29030 RepID=UPI003898DCC3
MDWKDACRICLKKSCYPINIFDSPSYGVLTTADVISRYTGSEVRRGDSLPENVCSMCLAEAIASQANRSKERQVGEISEFIVRNAALEDPPLDEEVFVISDYPVDEEETEEGDGILLESEAEVSPGIEEFQIIELEEEVKREPNGNEAYSNICSPNCQVNEEDEGQMVPCSCQTSLTSELSSLQEDTDMDVLYQCPFCPKTYKKRGFLKKHVDNHPPIVSKKKSVSQNVLPSPMVSWTYNGNDPFKCADCPRTFRLQSHLMSHRCVHEKHRCSVCLKTFKTHSELSLHMQDHDGPTFQCSICSQSFKFENDLKRHKRKHTHVHKCPNCPRSFQYEPELKYHVRRCKACNTEIN